MSILDFASNLLFWFFKPECFPTLCTIAASHTLKCLTVVFRVKETRHGSLSSKESPSIYNIHLAVKTERLSHFIFKWCVYYFVLPLWEVTFYVIKMNLLSLVKWSFIYSGGRKIYEKEVLYYLTHRL